MQTRKELLELITHKLNEKKALAIAMHRKEYEGKKKKEEKDYGSTLENVLRLDEKELGECLKLLTDTVYRMGAGRKEPMKLIEHSGPLSRERVIDLLRSMKKADKTSIFTLDSLHDTLTPKVSKSTIRYIVLQLVEAEALFLIERGRGRGLKTYYGFEDRE